MTALKTAARQPERLRRLSRRRFLTRVELHEGGDQLLDGERVVLHHLEEALGALLNGRVGDKQHLHQLGDKVGVPDVVLAADEHHQEGDHVLHAGLVQHLGRIPGETDG